MSDCYSLWCSVKHDLLKILPFPNDQDVPRRVHRSGTHTTRDLIHAGAAPAFCAIPARVWRSAGGETHSHEKAHPVGRCAAVGHERTIVVSRTNQHDVADRPPHRTVDGAAQDLETCMDVGAAVSGIWRDVLELLTGGPIGVTVGIMVLLLPPAAAWAVVKRSLLAVVPLMAAAFVYVGWFLSYAVEHDPVGMEVFLPFATILAAAWVVLVFALIRSKGHRP